MIGSLAKNLHREKEGSVFQLLLDFMKSGAGLFAAVGAMLAGIAALLQAWNQIGGGKPMNKRTGPPLQNSKQPRRYIRGFAILGGVFVSISLLLLVTRAVAYSERPLNEELTTAAWNALVKGSSQEAKMKAQACIKEFGPAADREQAELKLQNAPSPPKGKVTDAEAKSIFNRGLLNDVATSYFILGKAAEALSQKAEAIKAYEKATTYTYARTWDPKGWFWSPAEGASDRLTAINSKP